MSSVHLPTRRTILALGLSISGTFTLSSCARPEGRTSQYEYSEVYPTPSQTFEQNRGADYSGTIQLGTYEKHGKYVPGTQEHKAQNVPKPLQPHYINEYSSDGMYAFLAYWVESVNYAYLTGDIKPLSQVTDATATIPSAVLDLYQKNTGWVIGPQHIFTIELSTPGSHDVTLESPDRIWQSIINISSEAQVYDSTNNSTQSFLKVIDRVEKEEVNARLRYLDGYWNLVKEDGSINQRKPL